jgi:hypothetical protein
MTRYEEKLKADRRYGRRETRAFMFYRSDANDHQKIIKTHQDRFVLTLRLQRQRQKKERRTSLYMLLLSTTKMTEGVQVVASAK